jgi:uncharacterized protein with ATP-grasp and redox domains
MKIALDCIPCLLRQALEATRRITEEPTAQEQLMREITNWFAHVDLHQSPPAIAQLIHRRLRQVTGVADPYSDEKVQQNLIALQLLPELRSEIRSSASPLMTAARIATAGNMIDMGANGHICKADIDRAIRRAASAPFSGEFDLFAQAVSNAHTILYLADNAGEIVFDRLLIEQISPGRVTLAVRGAPVLNDATLADARSVGLDTLVELIDNGSDAPGTLLEDCSSEFRRRFAAADLIVAKGQGNFESLNEGSGNIFYFLKVKCSLVANHIQQPLGILAMLHSNKGGPTIYS